MVSVTTLEDFLFLTQFFQMISRKEGLVTLERKVGGITTLLQYIYLDLTYFFCVFFLREVDAEEGCIRRRRFLRMVKSGCFGVVFAPLLRCSAKKALFGVDI
jgi:hypothetical protein